jgi:hypothetical protein
MRGGRAATRIGQSRCAGGRDLPLLLLGGGEDERARSGVDSLLRLFRRRMPSRAVPLRQRHMPL